MFKRILKAIEFSRMQSALQSLPDSTLKDIGMSRGDIYPEAHKLVYGD